MAEAAGWVLGWKVFLIALVSRRVLESVPACPGIKFNKIPFQQLYLEQMYIGRTGRIAETVHVR